MIAADQDFLGSALLLKVKRPPGFRQTENVMTKRGEKSEKKLPEKLRRYASTKENQEKKEKTRKRRKGRKVRKKIKKLCTYIGRNALN